jgi:hypothetical protein
MFWTLQGRSRRERWEEERKIESAFLALEVRKIRIEGRIATMMRRRLREASRNARLRW